MALVVIPSNSISYQALSTDISGSKITGANYIGASVYITDTRTWYRILSDLTLEVFATQISGSVTATTSGSVNVGNFPANQVVSGSVSITGTPTVSATSGSIILIAGEAHAGAMGGNYFSITMTPTLSSGSAYVANDFVGTNNTAITFANAARVNGGTGRIMDATLFDYITASVAAELWIFESAPTGVGLDTAAFTITDADDLTCIGVIVFQTYQASALNSHSDGEMKNGSIGFTSGSASRDIFGCLVTRGAPAYTNGLVSVRIGVSQD